MPRDFSDKPRKGGKTNGKGKGKGRGKQDDDDKPHGIRLPGSLLDELKTGTAEVEAGDNRYTLSSNFVNKKGGKGKPVSRKEERKAQRQDKKRRKVENQRVQVRDKIINQHQTSKSNLKTSSSKPHSKKSVKFSTGTKSGPTSHSPEDTDSATESFGEDDDYEEMDFEEGQEDQPQTVENTMAALMAMKKAKSLQKDKLEKEQRSKHLENKAKSSTKSTTHTKKSQYEESHSSKSEIDPLTESLLRRDEDDIKHYAKLLGMKSTKGKDFKQAKGKNDLDDGLDDLLDGLEFLDEYGSGADEQAEKSKSLSQKRSRDESESESESEEDEDEEDEELQGFSDDEDQPQTVDETMAALMAMKAAKNKNKAPSNGGKPSELKLVKQQESDSEDIDSFGDSSDYEDFEQDADAMEDFSGSDEDMDVDDDDEEFGDDQPQTVEDTMAALMAMKAAKNSNNNKKEDKKKKDKQKNSNIKEPEPPKKEIDPLTESLLRRDEDDIKHYAKLLGMKSTKVKDMQRDAGDGLDDLFEGLDFLDGYGGGPSEQSEEEEESEESESEAESELEQDDDQEETVENPFSSDDEINSSDFDDSFGSGEEDDEEGEGGPASAGETFMAPKNENPYAPATTNSAATTTGKYVPPALRAKQQAALDGSDANSAEFQLLKRQVKGPLNKLSESNTVSIISEILDLYNGNPRQLVTEAITVIVLDSVKQQGVNLLDTFIVLYAALISGIYKVQGVEAGAYFVQTLIEEFELAVKSGDNKISGNLVSLICGVYSFGVVGCKLIYGLIKSLLAEATELHSELLLRIVRACGQSLRSDDPMALRDIVIELQQSALGKDTNSRTKFLIETVTNLKNNKSRALAHSQLTTDLITNLKKQLSKTIKANKQFAEPLQVTLEDIHSVATKGKWWVVGSAWRNNLHGVLDSSSSSSSSSSDLVKEQMNEILDSAEPNWIQLAKSNRMNTDIRRAIFITILSSQDFIDAFTKLDKLRLNKTQEREIPKVLLHCVGMEGAFNPYYGLLGNKLCTGYAMRKAFQFCLWDLIKDIEGDDDDYDNSSDDDNDGDTKKRFKLNANDDDMDEDSKLRKLVNLAKFYGSLLSEGSLALHVLKDINFINANEDLTVFLEVLMIQFLDSVGKKSEVSSFGSGLPSTEISRNGNSSRASKADDLIFKDDLLIQRLGKCDKQHRMLMGLQWFLTEKVRSSDIISGRKQRKRVEWGCDSGADVIAELVKKGPQDSGKDMDEDSGDEI